MIKLALTAIGTLLCLGTTATAQSFSHTHGEKGHHSHDTTIYTVSGDCCCDTQGHSTVIRSNDELHGAATSRGHITRTYTRTSVHPTVERRVYIRTVPQRAVHHRTTSHSHHHQSEHRQNHHQSHSARTHHQSYSGLSHDERRARDYASAEAGHSDRAHAWAHYDRRWRLRTNDKRH